VIPSSPDPRPPVISVLPVVPSVLSPTPSRLPGCPVRPWPAQRLPSSRPPPPLGQQVGRGRPGPGPGSVLLRRPHHIGTGRGRTDVVRSIGGQPPPFSEPRQVLLGAEYGSRRDSVAYFRWFRNENGATRRERANNRQLQRCYAQAVSLGARSVL